MARSTTASRLKQRGREAHNVVLDAGERTLVKPVHQGVAGGAAVIPSSTEIR
jgi:hypothetical protein